MPWIVVVDCCCSLWVRSDCFGSGPVDVVPLGWVSLQILEKNVVFEGILCRWMHDYRYIRRIYNFVGFSCSHMCVCDEIAHNTYTQGIGSSYDADTKWFDDSVVDNNDIVDSNYSRADFACPLQLLILPPSLMPLRDESMPIVVLFVM